MNIVSVSELKNDSLQDQVIKLKKRCRDLECMNVKYLWVLTKILKVVQEPAKNKRCIMQLTEPFRQIRNFIKLYVDEEPEP